MSLRNVEIRQLALERHEPSLFISATDSRLVDEGAKGTKLYEVRNFFAAGRRDYCMTMTDPSNGREYIEWVPPTVAHSGDAELCQAAAFGISLEDWLNVITEA